VANSTIQSATRYGLLQIVAANIIHEFYAKSDPNLIIKFLLCCREDGMDSFSRARMPDLATNNTIDTIINVDNRLMGLGCLSWRQPRPMRRGKSVIII